MQYPPDIEQRVADRLRDGSYQSEEEVLRDAMDALDQLEEDKLTRWNARNQRAEEESRQGLSKPLDDSAVLSRMRSRLAADGIVS